jgi:type I restriction enzyme S subunit
MGVSGRPQVLAGKAEFGERFPTPRKWCSAPQRVDEAGDILVSVRAPVGPTNVAAVRCCFGRGLAAIRADGSKLEADYLRFFLRHSEPCLASMGQGSTFAAIGRADIISLRIPLLPLNEQRRIADLLSRAEGIVRLCREAQKKAAEITPALFLDMFGDPATTRRVAGRHIR